MRATTTTSIQQRPPRRRILLQLPTAILLLELLLLLLQISPSISQLSSSAPTSSSSTSTTSSSTSSPSLEWEPICPPEFTGSIHSPNCTHYISCTNGILTTSIMECSAGTLYSVEISNCDWEANVVCNADATTTEEASTSSSPTGEDGSTSPPHPPPPPPPPPEPTISPTTYAPQTRPPSGNLGVEDALFYAADDMNNKLFIVQNPDGTSDNEDEGGGGGRVPEGWSRSKLYRFHGFIEGLRKAYMEGVGDMKFYLGTDDTTTTAATDVATATTITSRTLQQDVEGIVFGLVNIAAFLSQSMKETIKYDACDENNWDIVDGKYPLSNACGQLGQSYQDYNCPDEFIHMQCQVDPNMELNATTQASWYGAPGPLFCGPTSTYPTTGFWDYTYNCDFSWDDPPRYCEDYEGQKGGRYDNSEVAMNRNNRTDVMGCCWWGRGVIQTTGVCNFGILNYYIGKRAADEGRTSAYPDIDFCKDPGAVCSRTEYPELKWIAGMFYWIRSVQTYDSDGWNYMDNLKAFVRGGLTDDSFIDGVSGIVNRGCHNPPCDNGSGALDGGFERKENFKKALEILLEPDGSPRVFRSLEPTKQPDSVSPVSTPTPIMSSDFENNEAWVNDAWISDDEWPSSGGEQQEDSSETSNSIEIETEDEDWSETTPSSPLNLWCGGTLDNAIENCGRNGYDCPDGICVNDLKCFTVGDACGDDEGTDLPFSEGSTSPSLAPGVLTIVPTTIADDASQSPVSAAESDTTVNNFGLLGQYCASTLAALETECITAITCEKSEDCPEGTYCWGERLCGSTNTTITPTLSSESSPSPVGLRSNSPSLTGSGLANEQPTLSASPAAPSPSGLRSHSPSSIGSGLPNEQITQPNSTLQFVCGTDLVHASTNCHKPCPGGSYEECEDGEACFENISCEIDSTPTLPPQLLGTTTQPTQEVTSSSQPPSILSPEQFFCASTIEELETSCATAQSCTNGPCPTGVYCFPYTCTADVNGENPATIDSAKSQVPVAIEPTTAPVQVMGLCPKPPFVGWHTSADCKEYFQCVDGAMGVVYVCGASQKFDKVRNECHPEQYVNSFCYGPPQGKEPTASIELLCADGYIGWESRNNCLEYFWCDRGRFDVVNYCPSDQLFDKMLGHCNLASQVTCMEGGGGSTMTNTSTVPMTSDSNSSTVGVTGGVVGNFNWSDAPTASAPQNTSSDAPPWLANSIMTKSSGGCIKGVDGRRFTVWRHVGTSMILCFLWSKL